MKNILSMKGSKNIDVFFSVGGVDPRILRQLRATVAMIHANSHNDMSKHL